MTDRKNSTSDKGALLEQLHSSDRSRLREIQAQARKGRRLEHPAHLYAALTLGEAYRSATGQRKGARREFEDRVREELAAEGKERESFQVQKWKLPPKITAITAEVRDKYRDKSEPQKSLRHYLAAIRVAADMSRQDREAAQIAFLKRLSIWTTAPRLDVADEARDAAERLCRLLDAMGRAVARKTDLMRTFRQHDQQPMYWAALENRLEASRGNWFAWTPSPVYPEPDIGSNIDETRPYPSVPLVRVPLGWLDGEIEVEEGAASCVAHPGAPRALGRFVARPARVVQYREIHLALAPLGQHEVGPVLMSRGFVAANGLQVFGTLHWQDLLSYEQEIWTDGGWRRVRLPDADKLTHLGPGPGTDYDWEYDPVERPGMIPYLGADRVSYTRLTPDHLHYWLFEAHEVSGEAVQCPWEYVAYQQAATEWPPSVASPDPQTPEGFVDRYWRDVPLEGGLASPEGTPARAIEICLFNGLIEEALRSQTHTIVEQTVAIIERARELADKHHDALMARWS